jgi:septum formation protein
MRASADNLFLASRSPRRRELLDQIAARYQILDVDIDEGVLANESPGDYVLRMASEKALQALLSAPPRARVLAADTAVVIDGEILGKPDDAEQAAEMLRALSGHTHQVFTGIALACAGINSMPSSCETRFSESQVRFRRLDDGEIQTYIATGEPMDKAGAYAIQGRAAIFIEHLQGSYSGVMGLPLFEVAQLLNARKLHQ